MRGAGPEKGGQMWDWIRQRDQTSYESVEAGPWYLILQDCLKSSRLKGAQLWSKKKPQHSLWGPVSDETVQVWLLSPEKKPLFVVARRGISGDPVIKYSS